MKSVVARDGNWGIHKGRKVYGVGAGVLLKVLVRWGQEGKGALIKRITKTACNSFLPRYKNHGGTEVLPACPPAFLKRKLLEVGLLCPLPKEQGLGHHRSQA